MNQAVVPQPSVDPRRWGGAGLCCLGGVIAEALSWQSLLSLEATATNTVSPGLWRALVAWLGGRMAQDDSGAWFAEVDFLPLFFGWLIVAGVGGLFAAWVVRRNSQVSWTEAFTTAGFASGWWWLMGVWEVARLFAFTVGWLGFENFLLATPALWQGLVWAGWMAVVLSGPQSEGSGQQAAGSMDRLTGRTGLRARLAQPSRRTLVLLMVIYVVVFTAMNWRLWFNLRIPHGDSAMYEEHLWNLWHGRGFRSYLDQGLFLGEHIQVIHLLLLPLHMLWPSHLLMELCQSTALALGAIPVFRMARRSTGSDRAGLLMSAAYLLYFPLHFLDIEVDLKTFRPESFCVPFFLFAFDALEEKRLRRVLILLAIALSAKEDYSIIIAPLGVWVAVTSWLEMEKKGQRPSAFGFRLSADKWAFGIGCGLALFGVAYLLLATRVVIPWFRDGAELHYVKYFSKFGDTMNEVVWNMLTKPSLLFGELLTVKTALYAASLLLPVGFVALLAPGRLAVGLPLFGILCLNELAADPRHHFHAPLVPVVFWATAVGVGNASAFFKKLRTLFTPSPRHPVTPSSSWDADSFARQFVWTSALASGLFFSLGLASISFWDPHSGTSLWRLYARDPRADHFAAVFVKIPHTARVASTDFVHPRFTHHERSYDYSHYRRRVAGYEDRVPDDTDFIVIDTRHPYSDIQSPSQVRELRTEPDRWELLSDDTQGHFIVLRRRQ